MSNSRLAPWPAYSEEEADTVRRILLSNKVNYWTGTEGREFEKEFAAYIGTEYAVAVANGSVALGISLRSLGVGPGDEVVVTPRTFVASVHEIVLLGATPVYADVDLDSQNITAATIKAVLTPRTKAIICVHLAGWPCDMHEIMALAQQNNLYVVEDCAQAHGARIGGQSVGSFGDIAAWSFCQDKIMTTGGEGGMITTNNKQLWDKAWSFKDHGKSWSTVYKKDHPPGFRYLHEDVGSNHRLTEMQSAIGRIQLRKLDDWQKERAANAQSILGVCEKFQALRVPSPPAGIRHAWYRCYVFIESTKLHPDWSQQRIIQELARHGVPSGIGSCPEVYLEKGVPDSNATQLGRLPNAQQLGETALVFLVHPGQSKKDMDTVCQVVTEVISEAAI